MKRSEILALAALAVGIITAACGVIDSDSAAYPGGVAMGLWLSSLYLWVTDPDTYIAP